MSATFRLDTREFETALRDYIPTTRRDLAEIVNKRACNVATRAMQLTPKADAGKIQRQLGEIGRGLRVLKSGKNKGKFGRGARIFAGMNNKMTAPRAALIINARRRRAGLPGLEGKAMERAILHMVGARAKSVAFIKSGWIPAIQQTAAAAKTPARIEAGVRQAGRAKGYAIPARPLDIAQAVIVNAAGGRGGAGDKALEKYGGPALQRALNDEAAEITRHVAEKLQNTASRFNGRRS